MSKKISQYIERHSDKHNKNLKYDFMPSLLEIIERPSHIAGTVIIWTIFALMVFAFMWSYFSKVEVIISAKGSIEPVQDADILQAESTYKIVAVNVEEGQTVKEGDLLLELLPEYQEDELEESQKELKKYTNQIDLYNRILAGEDISVLTVSAYEKSEQNDLQDIIDDYQNNKKMVQQYISDNYPEEAEEINEDYQKSIVSSLNQMELDLEELNETIEELNKAIENAKVYAPYDGIIYKLYVEKEDGTVSEEQPMVSLVRQDCELEMECHVKNSDVADIKLNQKVNIKLDAYPYADYGTIDGIVTFISEKAENVDGIGKAVTIKVSITDKAFHRKLLIGLSGSAEMVVNKRRVIDYFLEPITKAFKESIREK